eukprot:gene27908-30965_t
MPDFATHYDTIFWSIHATIKGSNICTESSTNICTTFASIKAAKSFSNFAAH